MKIMDRVFYGTENQFHEDYPNATLAAENVSKCEGTGRCAGCMWCIEIMKGDDRCWCICPASK